MSALDFDGLFIRQVVYDFDDAWCADSAKTSNFTNYELLFYL